MLHANWFLSFLGRGGGGLYTGPANRTLYVILVVHIRGFTVQSYVCLPCHHVSSCGASKNLDAIQKLWKCYVLFLWSCSRTASSLAYVLMDHDSRSLVFRHEISDSAADVFCICCRCETDSNLRLRLGSGFDPHSADGKLSQRIGTTHGCQWTFTRVDVSHQNWFFTV
jgi:hypothetical protein